MVCISHQCEFLDTKEITMDWSHTLKLLLENINYKYGTLGVILFKDSSNYNFSGQTFCAPLLKMQ